MKLRSILAFTLCWSLALFADNQTQTLSPIYPEDDSLPFTLEIELADFQLASGLQAFESATHDGKWLLICGRTNGLHDFSQTNDNFPPQMQNTNIFVVDPERKYVAVRSLYDHKSGLTQEEIDTLSVTSAQSYQEGDTLYLVGGYGVITSTGEFSTKNTLTAIDVPGLMHWVMDPDTHHTAKEYIRQTSNEALRVTGGHMTKIGDNPTLLVFGQNFAGYYYDNSNGEYTRQVRRFEIEDDGKHLHVHMKEPFPEVPDPNYRRRDLNVVPCMKHEDGKTVPALIAYSGVFTPTTGIWTVPVDITACGCPSMPDPFLTSTFKQGMNNYISPTLGLYARKDRDMYTVIFGGISFGYFQNGVFETDSEIPFINQVTTIKRHHNGYDSQFLMNATYPTLISTQVNAGNTLLFGAGATFFLKDDIDHFENGVVKLDHLKKGKHHIGYIVGGIQSTVPNTTSFAETTASACIFNVYVWVKE